VPFFGIRFDLRNPDFAGTTMHERYAAALDMAAWAESAGFLFVGLSEHHGSEDGYLPSPLVMAGAVAARTKSVAIVVAAMIAPFHDPLRLAEDAAVVDNLCGGRLELIIAGGYVPDEFAMFGVDLSERAARTTELITTLQGAWTGEPFEYRGRTVQVAPRPHRPGGPGLQLGGSSAPAARRAARLGIGFQPSDGDSWPAYAAECVALGRPDPGPYPGGDTTVTFVAQDPDAYWDAVAPFAMHESNAYGAWAEAAGIETGYSTAETADELRATGKYRVVTPAAMVSELNDAGPAAFAIFHPMLGGIPPELAWQSLHTFEHEVLPHLT
jgi:alkanesulfonate monooxygenase SsuD/methylene tetrahydromethanopterin reductase-like flavin-dependent oxidoreductase (luciferase family)